MSANIRNEKVKEFFDSPVYLEKNLNTNIVVRSILVKELLGKIDNKRILDLGCGDGSISLQYVSHVNQIVLVDLSQRMLDKAYNKISSEFKNRVVCRQDDLRAYQSEDKYDIVLCIGVLAHVPSIDEVIGKISQLLKSGGRCVVQITDYRTLFGKIAYWGERIIKPRQYQYKLNKIVATDIKSVALAHALYLDCERRYSLCFPGVSKILRKKFLKYQLFTARNKILSRHGSEVLFLFSKRDI